MNSWIVLLYGLPAKQNAGRVQIWRKLKKFGALQLKTSAYVLPDEPVHHERFQWLATQIRDRGGDATLIRVSEIEGLPHEKVVAMFNDARAVEYSELINEISGFMRANKKRLTDGFSAGLESLQVRYHEIREADYFQCEKGQLAQIMLRQAEALAHKAAPHNRSRPRSRRREYVGRIWLTRPRPQIDRVASAWLIRKFIDPKAKFVFGTDLKKFPDAIPYDMFEVEFSHRGEDCTFETLMKCFGIEDRAVQAISEMVHDADLEDGKFKRFDCIGIDRILCGWGKLNWPDEQILARGFELFDSVYATLSR
jgi:hypothetical protein